MFFYIFSVFFIILTIWLFFSDNSLHTLTVVKQAAPPLRFPCVHFTLVTTATQQRPRTSRLHAQSLSHNDGGHWHTCCILWPPCTTIYRPKQQKTLTTHTTRSKISPDKAIRIGCCFSKSGIIEQRFNFAVEGGERSTTQEGGDSSTIPDWKAAPPKRRRKQDHPQGVGTKHARPKAAQPIKGEKGESSTTQKREKKATHTHTQSTHTTHTNHTQATTHQRNTSHTTRFDVFWQKPRNLNQIEKFWKLGNLHQKLWGFKKLSEN